MKKKKLTKKQVDKAYKELIIGCVEDSIFFNRITRKKK